MGHAGDSPSACVDRLEVLPPQPVQHAAPELGIAADVVVGVRHERLAALVEPLLGGSVAQVLPDRYGIPVLDLARHEVAALEQEQARPAVGKRIRERASARAAADDDDVETLVLHPSIEGARA